MLVGIVAAGWGPASQIIVVRVPQSRESRAGGSTRAASQCQPRRGRSARVRHVVRSPVRRRAECMKLVRDPGTLLLDDFMAANLAKWWRNRFLNGYKQFTVVPTDCSDGRPSDTEELLGRQHDCSAASDKETNQEKKSAPSGNDRQLNFEEFECDVSVEGGVDSGGQERQEFSFTLYDFDGHGKITKDDIAGLVTTIYDTLGSSIKVPHYGSKTIKVKLTVSPEQRQKAAAATPHRVKFKRDLNVTIQESRRPGRRRRHEDRPPPPPPPPPRRSCSSASENNEEAADASEEEEDEEDEPAPGSPHSPHSTPRAARDSGGRSEARRHQHAPPRHRQPVAPVPPRQRSKKARASSLQREELLQIIQANMEKNNLSFQTSRKPCTERPEARHAAPARTRHKLHYLSMGDYADPRYLDLAGMEPHGSEYHVYNLPQCRSRGHHRSRSHDLSGAFRYHLLDPHRPFAEHHARSRSHEAEFGHEHRCERKFPSATGHSSSPHHLKHRNREQDQARAMAQVVRWLEREFSSTLDAAAGKQGHSEAPGPTPPAKDPPSPAAERLEHHHVHEHIHHHYHHYQETPVLV
ncbi:protein naked cuticle homolog 2-like [Bacillus rossius redtenbacheri]|uniref:protein naked cuticle homolog 2-like n=1 Tax=Bacillus rossius redtenbacheri TaxID=93214 RepID=UPI002FDDA77B